MEPAWRENAFEKCHQPRQNSLKMANKTRDKPEEWESFGGWGRLLLSRARDAVREREKSRTCEWNANKHTNHMVFLYFVFSVASFSFSISLRRSITVFSISFYDDGVWIFFYNCLSIVFPFSLAEKRDETQDILWRNEKRKKTRVSVGGFDFFPHRFALSRMGSVVTVRCSPAVADDESMTLIFVLFFFSRWQLPRLFAGCCNLPHTFYTV